MNVSYDADEQRLILVDALLLSYRCGHLKFEEEQVAMLAAMRAAHNAMEYMTALENFGVRRQSELFSFVSKMLSAPAFYRAQYPMVLGLRKEDEAPETFLGNPKVLFLVEALLTRQQRQTFTNDYWWFVHNHQQQYYDTKKGWTIGAYATAPQDNAATLARFEGHLQRLQNHSNQKVRDRYEGFPLDLMMLVLRRTFL